MTSARLQPSGWSDWLLWSKVCHEHSTQPEFDVGTVIEMLEVDRGDLLSFALVTARKNA